MPKYTIDKNNCWNWNGYIQPNGYPEFKRKGFPRGAHRYFYEQYKGKITEGFQVDHLCKNRKCVNPEHLEAVRQAENVRRGLLAKLTKEDVKKIKSLKGKFNQYEIAEMFGINQCSVSRIMNEKRWKGGDSYA